MSRRRLTPFILVFLFTLTALAQENTIIADADEMEKNSRAKTISLKGNVNVIFQQQHLLCDEAIVFENTSTIIARGNVILQNARTTMRGDKIEFNYQTNTGKLFNGMVESGQVLIQSDVIEKVGEDSYEAENAYYTACLTCPPSWGFTTSKVKADIGGYAYISRPWLYLLQVPVLPMPYLIVPLNSRRQTGILVPHLGNSNGGLTFEQPFFWAIDRSHDATFSLINYEKRGLQLFTNYRYVISPTSSGEMNASYLKDRMADSIYLDDRARGYRDRWFLQYKHLYEMPENYTQRMEIVLASDQQFVVDFPRQLQYIGQAALDNNISLTKSYDRSLLTLDSSYYVSLIDQRLNLANPDSLHRMPEVNYRLIDQKISDDYNVYFNFNMQYLNIARQASAYETARGGAANCPKTNGDHGDQDVCYISSNPGGRFVYGSHYGTPYTNENYGDLIRSGQRLDIAPSFHAPFWLGSYVDMDPSLTFRYTQYSLGVESDPTQGYSAFPSRFYTQLNLSAKTYLSQVYQWNEETKLRHSIIPAIDYKYIPQLAQTEHNFFGTQQSLNYFRELQPLDDTDSDWRNGGRGIQFDRNDRVIGRHFVNFSLLNKVISRTLNSFAGVSSVTSPYEQNLYFMISQAFDINEAQKGPDARPWQDIRTSAVLTTGPLSQIVSTAYYPYHNRTTWQTATRYTFLSRNYVQIGYNKNYLIGSSPPVDENTKTENVIFTSGLDFKYVDLHGSVEYNLNARDGIDPFTRWRLFASVTPPGSCWTLFGSLEQSIGLKQPNPSISMEFTFGE